MAKTKDKLTPKHARLMRSRITGVRTLGLRTRRADELVRKVQAGFAFAQLANLEKESGLSRERLAEFVAIPIRTLVRRQSTGQLNAVESDRVLRAARIFELAVNLFEGNADEARDWLQTPNPALGGDSPLAFASTDVGAREVEKLIGRLEHGVFV